MLSDTDDFIMELLSLKVSEKKKVSDNFTDIYWTWYQDILIVGTLLLPLGKEEN